jgi:predicted RND superfamily exporter protein
VSNRLFHRYSNWIVDYPVIPFLLIGVISAFAFAGHFAPDTIYDWLYAQPEDKATSARSTSAEPQVDVPEVDAYSMGGYHASLLAESESFFTPAGAKTLRHVVKRLEELDYVTEVLWVDEIPTANIFGLPEPLFPHETASQNRFDRAKEKALKNPLIAGQFLSADAQTLLLQVNFDFFYVRENDDCIVGLRKVAEEAAAEVSDLEVEFFVTGRIPLFITAFAKHEWDVWKYQIIGYTMILIMALILFRGIAAVTIVAIAPILGVFWTVGFLPYFNMQYNPFNDEILPILVSLVGLTDGVHLMVHIRKLRAEGLDVREAARQGVHEVGLACFLTSLTTAIGFGALSLASHEVVREFGWSCVLGVACTFVSVMMSIPLLTASPLGRNVHRGLEKSLIDKHLTRIGGLVDYVLMRTRLFSSLGIGITVALAIVCLWLQPDERQTEGLPQSAEPVIALAKMDEALGGLELGEVYIGWDDSIESDSQQVLDVVTEVDQLLQAEPLIGHPISIRNLIDAMPGDPQAANRMPMLELLPPELKRAFYTPETRQGTVMFRVQDIGIAKYGPVFERLIAGLDEIKEAHPAFEVELQGSAVRRWEEIYTILIDLVKSLVSASFVIFICLSIAYRSLRIGLISIIPNLFPLVLSAAFLVFTGQYLEFVGVCAFTICLGIAVDDTIHFLTRYTEELKKTDDEEAAIRNAFTGVGTALIMTTLVLLAGFVTVSFGDAREVRTFASLGGITIASALLGDLLFLPALLSRFARPRT